MASRGRCAIHGFKADPLFTWRKQIAKASSRRLAQEVCDIRQRGHGHRRRGCHDLGDGASRDGRPQRPHRRQAGAQGARLHPSVSTRAWEPRVRIQGRDGISVSVRAAGERNLGQPATVVRVTITRTSGPALARYGRISEFLAGRSVAHVAQGEWLSRGGIYVGARTDSFFYAGTSRFRKGSSELRRLRALVG
jgi:hypothetical protein